MSKSIKKLAVAMGASTVVAAMSVAPAFAASPGQLESGSLLYQVKNLSQHGSYSASASANCGEELQYSVRLHNTEFGALNNVTVKATLPNSVHASADTGSAVDGSVNVSLASGSLSYENGSTVLYDSKGNVIKNLADGITNGGINVGTLNGSTTEFVNFKVKVTCPVTPKETPKTPAQPSTLPQTGPEAGLAATAGTGALGYAVMQYRRSRKALADKLRNR